MMPSIQSIHPIQFTMVALSTSFLGGSQGEGGLPDALAPSTSEEVGPGSLKRVHSKGQAGEAMMPTIDSRLPCHGMTHQ